MERNSYRRSQPPTQVHYHYHYHCPHGAATYIPSRHLLHSHSQTDITSESSLGHPHSHEAKPTISDSQGQQGGWKEHLNPEVSRMYAEFVQRQSRKSGLVKSKASLNTQSQSRLTTYHQEGETVWATPANKLSRLTQCTSKSRLRTQPSGSRVEEEEEGEKTEDMTGLTLSEETEAKLREYEKEIARLRLVEEECIYLRKKFVRHLQRRHRKEFKCN